MEELIELLNSVKEDIDFSAATDLVDEGVLDSLEIVKIIYAIEEKYGIEINPDDIDPDNFQSAKTMWDMIQNAK